MTVAITASVLGSFRRYYPEVLEVIRIFESAGIRVQSPVASRIINPNDDFVRFESDSIESEDTEIQLRTLIKISMSSFVYVVAPNGYVGRTTSYEIGRIHERRIPLYFSERPLDLPIIVPESTIRSAEDLANEVLKAGTAGTIDLADVPEVLRLLDSKLSAIPPFGQSLPFNDYGVP